MVKYSVHLAYAIPSSTSANYAKTHRSIRSWLRSKMSQMKDVECTFGRKRMLCSTAHEMHSKETNIVEPGDASSGLHFQSLSMLSRPDHQDANARGATTKYAIIDRNPLHPTQNPEHPYRTRPSRHQEDLPQESFSTLDQGR